MSGRRSLTTAHFVPFRHVRRRSSKACDSRNNQRKIQYPWNLYLQCRQPLTMLLNNHRLRHYNRGMRLYHRASSPRLQAPQATSSYLTQVLCLQIHQITTIRVSSNRMAEMVSPALSTAIAYGGHPQHLSPIYCPSRVGSRGTARLLTRRIRVFPTLMDGRHRHLRQINIFETANPLANVSIADSLLPATLETSSIHPTPLKSNAQANEDGPLSLLPRHLYHRTTLCRSSLVPPNRASFAGNIPV